MTVFLTDKLNPSTGVLAIWCTRREKKLKGIQGPTSNNQNHKMIIVPVSPTRWIHNPRKEDWIIATQVEYICCCLWQKTMDNNEKVLNHGNSWRWIKKFWKEGCKSTTMYIGKQSEAKKVWKIYVENNIFFNQKGEGGTPSSTHPWIYRS